jgi:hypothetical protein
VTDARSVRYGYNRSQRRFFAAIREEGGRWRYVSASGANLVIFNTYLSMRAWRRRIRYATPGAESQEMLVGWSLRQTRPCPKLLATRSDRPFREVLRHCFHNQVLDGLVLALSLTESGHDAVIPRSLFYGVTMDEFGATMTLSRIREGLSIAPKRVLTEARARLARATTGFTGSCTVQST